MGRELFLFWFIHFFIFERVQSFQQGSGVYQLIVLIMEESERNVDTLTLCPATPSFKSCRDSLEGLELKFTHPSVEPHVEESATDTCTSHQFYQSCNDIGASLEHSDYLMTEDKPTRDDASYKEPGILYNSSGEVDEVQNDNIEDFMDNFLLDSISVQCHASVFCTQFLCHLFFPLSYFLINYRAQGFDIHSNFLCNPISYFNIIFPSLIYLMVVMYYLCPLEDELPIRGALWVPIIFFIQHRMTVGLKYASLSPSEYAKFQASPDSTQAEAFMLQMQLLTGWANRTDQLLQFELGCAAARIGAKINEVSIIIPNPSESETTRNEFANWNALLHRESTVSLLNNRIAKELVPHADGSYTLSVYDLSMAILKKTDTSSSQRVKWLIYVFVCMMIVVPWINLFRTANQFTHRSMYLFVFLGCNMVTLGVYGMVVFMLLYVSVWDVSRQWHMVRYLHRLIRISDLTLDSDLVTFRKGKNTARNREHLRERMSVILSVTQPERHKSLAIRTSQAALKTFPLYYEGTSPFTAPNITTNTTTTSNTTTGHIHIQSQVSNKELRSRFSEFGTKSLKDEDASSIPQISLKHAENVIGWTYTRLVIQHFGERFRNRIDMYTGKY